ncbi:Hypothetical protein AT6N2_L0860 [Agrobacterium tumefaciens]|nr:Hypothetical protein AT6N2_L0860 [Agrobacterium tumefaciens]
MCGSRIANSVSYVAFGACVDSGGAIRPMASASKLSLSETEKALQSGGLKNISVQTVWLPSDPLSEDSRST